MRIAASFLALVVIAGSAVGGPALAQAVLTPPAVEKSCKEGPSGASVPRFVSLKSNKARMRSGPDQPRFPIIWEYRRAGLPMEIIAEYCIWRKVRDPDGTIGWMDKGLLQATRTGYVTGVIRTLYTAPDLQSRVAWRVEPGTIVTITLCESLWCRVSNGGRSGYILRNQLWGTYPNEVIGG